MTTLLRLVLAAAAAFGLWAFIDAGPRAPVGGLVLDGAEVEAACAVSKFPAPEFFERAKAAGAQGVLLRPRTLAAAAKGGDLMVFTRADVDKMRRLGLLSAHSPLRADSLWSRDKEAVALIERMLKRRGLAATVTEMAGLRGLLLSEDAQPETLTVGYDRQALERILSKGLTPVFFIQDDADIEAAALAPAAGALLVSPAFHGPIAVPAL
ncbi:MAG: hypothetical protein HY922_09825, partial [Elusimicrobia bacterium]|nr:hypothetical protein [Elusimicrobiota bacterium]